MTATTPLTIEDFERLPAEMAEGHELVAGELVDVSGNVGDHNEIRDWSIALMLPFVYERRLGKVIGEQEYDFDGNAHGPDLSFFGPAKMTLYHGKRRVQKFVPDLALEVVSENDTFSSLMRKKDRYLKCGTKEVWIVDPTSREVYVYSESGNRIVGGQGELSTPLIPEFQLSVKRLFEPLGNT